MTTTEARTGDALLDIERVTKRFGGLVALSEVSFSIHKGEIYGLIGPNGAGKTTLFNVLTGLYGHDEGQFRFEGRPLGATTPDRIAALGIARTFQNIRLFANLSALENVMIGRHVRTKAGVVGAILRGPGTRAEETGDRAACPRAARLRGHRSPRQRTRAPPALRRPAPPRDRPRARHGARGCSPSTSPPRA